MGLPVSAKSRPIAATIEKHPFYSRVYYTVSPAAPEGLGAGEAYCGRSNLLLMVDGAGPKRGVGQAVNAHRCGEAVHRAET